MPSAAKVAAGSDRFARDVEILASVARSLLETTDIDEQLGMTLHLATEALGADRGSLLMADQDAKDLRIRASEGLPRQAAESDIPFGEGIAGWVAAHNEAVILHGDVADPRFEGVNPSIESSISLPLAVEGRVLGVLNVVRLAGGRFTEEDLRLASSLADLAAVAIEKARLYATLQERETLVSNLLGAVIQAQEHERQRLAADIHDGFLQDLSALFLQAEAAKMMLARENYDQAMQALEGIQTMVKAEVESLRDYIFEVRPPSLDQVGLAPTLRSMVDRFAAENTLTGDFQLGGDTQRLPTPLETILYRVAQEALRNVAKHAQATRITVRLQKRTNEVTLEVIDDGRGVDPDPERIRKPGHYGIDTMRERLELAGGSFQIGPGKGGGTVLVAMIPLGPAAE